jgi:hypothetical protein
VTLLLQKEQKKNHKQDKLFCLWIPNHLKKKDYLLQSKLFTHEMETLFRFAKFWNKIYIIKVILGVGW